MALYTLEAAARALIINTGEEVCDVMLWVYYLNAWMCFSFYSKFVFEDR